MDEAPAAGLESHPEQDSGARARPPRGHEAEGELPATASPVFHEGQNSMLHMLPETIASARYIACGLVVDILRCHLTFRVSGGATSQKGTRLPQKTRAILMKRGHEFKPVFWAPK